MFRKAFYSIIGEKESDHSSPLYWLFIAAVSTIISAISVFIIIHAIAWFYAKSPAESLGQTGDFFGGILNPILTFFTFVGVLTTVFLQRQELAETRRELSRQADALETQLEAIGKQNFESTFFQMMSFHNENVLQVKAQSDFNGMILTGRGAFRVFYEDLERRYRNDQEVSGNHSAAGQISSIERSYQSYWKDHRQELGHYYKFLFNLVRLVDNANAALVSQNSEDKRWEYVRLIRAQISDFELVLLFYNCITVQGQDFAVFAERYGILKHVQTDLLFSKQHREFLNERCFLNPFVD